MPGLATRWLAPRLSSIRKLLPGVDIEIRAIDLTVATGDIDGDLNIGFGDFNFLPAGAIPLIRPRMFPVASPEWLTENGRPASIKALARSSLIHEESHEQWTAWFEAAGVVLARPLSGILLGDASLGFDAALTGQGIALTTRLMVAKEIAAGTLEELFKTDVRLGGYYVIRRRGNHAKDHVSRFSDWLVAEIQKDDFAPRR
jgi:DNA-binding transcriptional LysR family regulator